MIKIYSKSPKALYLSKAQYWSVEYLKTVCNITGSEIIERAIKYSLEHIAKKGTRPRKPNKPTQPNRLDANISREVLITIELLKIKKELFSWSTMDFCRYGLKHLILVYEKRYPDLKKIKSMYDEGVN